MFSCRLRAHDAVWLAFAWQTSASLSSILLASALLFASGCNSAPRRIEPERFRDQFGAPLDTTPITEESVGREQMLHRRAQAELRGQAVFPVESNLEIGGGVGLKAEIETFKDLYFGVSFDWARLEADDQISDSVTGGDTAALLGAEPTELYEELEKHNILLLFDYDIPLVESFNFRAGLGAGIVVVTGDEGDNSEAFIDNYNIEPFVAFLLRPAIDFRWQVWEHGFVAIGASYDFVPEGPIRVDFQDERREVDEDVDFSSFNLGVSWVFEW